jgi:hypothetical protein
MSRLSPRPFTIYILASSDVHRADRCRLSLERQGLDNELPVSDRANFRSGQLTVRLFVGQPDTTSGAVLIDATCDGRVAAMTAASGHKTISMGMAAGSEAATVRWLGPTATSVRRQQQVLRFAMSAT